MSNTHITLQEQKILDAVPSFPGDRNKLPKEIILAAAKDFCEQFRRSVQAFNESNRDERFKPCMSQHKYADDIYRMIEVHLPRPLYHDKDNFYQVLFVVSCLMGVADHRRSWWEETFAQSTAEYLDNTNNFHGAKQQIQAVIREIDSMLQYELNFDFPDDDWQTEQQTQKLQQQAEDIDNELQQWMNQAQAEEQQRAQQPKAKKQTTKKKKPKSKNTVIQVPNGQLQLHLHFHEQVGNVITHVDHLNMNEQ